MFYSQCNEDELLYMNFFRYYTLEGQKYYFEMGAMDGITYSNTKFYEESLEWTGILVEGNPYTFIELIKNRPKNKLMNVICSNQKQSLSFNVCKNVPAVCSLDTTKPLDFNEKYYQYSDMLTINSIPVSLDTIINNSGVERLDLCVIDVEGHELQVLSSFSFQIPVVLWLIEFLDDVEKNDAVKKLMEENNCRYIDKCSHNAVFINNDYLKYFANLRNIV
jgi:FkbM family methyltransferase